MRNLGSITTETKSCTVIIDNPPFDSLGDPKRKYFKKTVNLVTRFCDHDVDGAGLAWVATTSCPASDSSNYNCSF